MFDNVKALLPRAYVGAETGKGYGCGGGVRPPEEGACKMAKKKAKKKAAKKAPKKKAAKKKAKKKKK